MPINSKNLLLSLKNKLNSIEILESTNITNIENKICDDIFKLIDSLNDQDNCDILLGEDELYTNNFIDPDVDYDPIIEDIEIGTSFFSYETMVKVIDLIDNGKRGVNDPNYKGKLI